MADCRLVPNGTEGDDFAVKNILEIPMNCASNLSRSLLFARCVLAALGAAVVTLTEVSARQQAGTTSANAQLHVRVGEHNLSVGMGPSSVVAVADKPLGWGFHQFPELARLDDGRLGVKWSMHPDSILSYGKRAHGAAVSDTGHQWQLTSELPEEFGSVMVPDGSRIKIHTPEAVSIRDLKMPEPAAERFDKTRKLQRLYFRHSELPERFKGVFLLRQPPGNSDWHEERAKLIDPAALRYSRGGLMPVVWWGDIRQEADGALMAGIYPGYFVDDQGQVEMKSGVFFYRSRDAGHSWEIVSRIPYQPDHESDPVASDRVGFTEPAFYILSDNTYLCVLRTSDVVGVGPMYQSISRDRGATWSRPKVITRTGVLPKLLQLENGVVVLSSGRPGVQVRFLIPDSIGTWSEPVEMLPYEGDRDSVSCGYTDLLATGPDRFLLAYSDFRYPAGDATRKAILVREFVVSRK